MKKILLSQGKFVLVDDRDFILLNSKKWYFSHGYAMRDEKDGRIYMHRIINNTSDNLQTDHINRNTLDNRRKNLRAVTRSQNKMNTGMWKHNTSGYKGVSWIKKDKKWLSQIKINNKNISLGHFINIKDAIKARKQGELLYHTI